MTLYELVNQTTVQGDVRVVKFDKRGNEHILINAENTDDLALEIPESWEDLTVKYIYQGQDWLTIEVSDED